MIFATMISEECGIAGVSQRLTTKPDDDNDNDDDDGDGDDDGHGDDHDHYGDYDKFFCKHHTHHTGSLVKVDPNWSKPVQKK